MHQRPVQKKFALDSPFIELFRFRNSMLSITLKRN
jgi:hypothetical protein